MSENDNFDILTWWKDHQETYPIFFIMSYDLLTSLVSIIAPKSTFNIGECISNDKRLSLHP